MNRTVNFYHRKTFFKKYSLEIFGPVPVPLPKTTSFDVARRVLSHDTPEIVMNKTGKTSIEGDISSTHSLQN
jgi:hypothetical protein